jgi:stage III sporulation protein SpoIIIAA
MDCEGQDIYDRGFNDIDTPISHECCLWITSLPINDKFKVVNVYSAKTFDVIDDSDKETSLLYHIMIDNSPIVMELSRYSDMSIVMLNRVYTTGYINYMKALNVFNSEYFKFLGIDKNVLSFENYTIKTRPRKSGMNITIDNMDFGQFKSHIEQILQSGHRRGYLLVGNPGTGKTTILLKLEEELIEYPIIYATSKNLDDHEAVIAFSRSIATVGACVVFIEDMDTLSIEDKSPKMASILEMIDNSKRDCAVVFIATINNSKLINDAVVRSGRFDEIIEVKEPTNIDSIYNIMKKHHSDLYGDEVVEFKKNDISLLLYKYMIWKKLTQADYCEIIHKLILVNKPVNTRNVWWSMNVLKKSKSAFKKYNKKK